MVTMNGKALLQEAFSFALCNLEAVENPLPASEKGRGKGVFSTWALATLNPGFDWDALV